MDPLSPQHGLRSGHVTTSDNILLSSLMTASEGVTFGDEELTRVCAHPNVTEEIMCMCECYKCKPCYVCVSPSGVLWYGGGISSFMRASIRTQVQVDEYLSMTLQGCATSTFKKKRKKVKKSEPLFPLTFTRRDGPATNVLSPPHPPKIKRKNILFMEFL